MGGPAVAIRNQKKRDYVAKVFQCKGIQLNPSKIKNKSGRKGVAKIMFNSFWGKFGQWDHLNQARFINDPEKYFELCRSEAVTLHDVTAVFPDCMMVTLPHVTITMKEILPETWPLSNSPHAMPG